MLGLHRLKGVDARGGRPLRRRGEPDRGAWLVYRGHFGSLIRAVPGPSGAATAFDTYAPVVGLLLGVGLTGTAGRSC